MAAPADPYHSPCAARRAQQGKEEAHRLRRELNAAFTAKAEKMMDVAMTASVQALSDEAVHQRRALLEQGILCDEVRAPPHPRENGATSARVSTRVM